MTKVNALCTTLPHKAHAARYTPFLGPIGLVYVFLVPYLFVGKPVYYLIKVYKKDVPQIVLYELWILMLTSFGFFCIFLATLWLHLVQLTFLVALKYDIKILVVLKNLCFSNALICERAKTSTLLLFCFRPWSACLKV